MEIVWFKRDLRISDHAPLYEATKSAEVKCIYILEPELWRQSDLSKRHYDFLTECLGELQSDLAGLGLVLHIEIAEAIDVLQGIHKNFSNFTLWSHQETWNKWTYERDKKVLSWCGRNGISWQELQQDGVVRRLQSRDVWTKKWNEYAYAAPVLVPKAIYDPIKASSLELPTYGELTGQSCVPCPKRQKGGRERAGRILNSFLYERGKNYSFAMSSPNTAFRECSRLSPYLSFGCISVREAYQATEARKKELLLGETQGGKKWERSLQSFSSRLRWHCHFKQKLEDEPELEFHNMHSAYDALERHKGKGDLFFAWSNGQTGIPFVDACMRALRDTGWLNFRMRAMLMSFASYQLWLDWRETSVFLARMFLDYEPGIHYPQVQMQSGTTGINSIRIYNPYKQSVVHDASGFFIRKWVPELCSLSGPAIHDPRLAANVSKLDYFLPIVNESESRKKAARILWGIKGSVKNSQITKDVLKKHASRKHTRAKTKQKQNMQQGSFKF